MIPFDDCLGSFYQKSDARRRFLSLLQDRLARKQSGIGCLRSSRFLSFRSFDSVNDHLKEIARLRFPAIINNWIDRQENPELAFYQYWTLSECLKDRNDPTVRIKIDDDDCLTVRGSSVLLRETFQFWTSEDWICTVQGPGLTNLLYAVRKPEKTLQLLDEAFEKFGTE